MDHNKKIIDPSLLHGDSGPSESRQHLEDDWDFRLDANRLSSLQQNVDENSSNIVKENPRIFSKNKKLLLEKNQLPKNRNHYQQELQNELKDKDIIYYASLEKRFFATLIDYSFLALLLKLSINFKLRMDVIFVIYFVFHIYLMSFKHVSVGKKIMGLMVRGEDEFKLNLSKVLLRELFLKPVSIASVLGVLLAFKHTKRQCMHDKILRTIVIQENL